MTGRILVRSRGRYRRLVAPWVHHGGAYRRPRKLFRKEEGVWVEWWPLRPPPPENIVLGFAFNPSTDNIEISLTWETPDSPIAVERYEVSFSSGSAVSTEDTSISGGVWDAHIGTPVVATITAISEWGVRGEPGTSQQVTVPNYPPPPPPTSVAISMANRSATLTWASITSKRISRFTITTTYREERKTISTPNATPRSQNITMWSTAATPGDPGGVVGSIIRAEGPGGVSAWASSQGTLPNVPNPPPPPTVAIPGTPVITNHRFLNGTLRCNFTVPGASTVNLWWEKSGGSRVSLGTAAATGSVSVAATTPLARDGISLYRIVVQGRNSGGQTGATAVGTWARKMPNPIYVSPEHTLAVRLNEIWDDGQMRQGASFNEFNYKNPVIIWRSFALYGNRIVNGVGAKHLGYSPTITSAEVFLWRQPTGGQGGAVQPRLWYHPYTAPSQIMGFSLSGGHDLAGLARDQGSFLPINLAQARAMVAGTGPKGVAVYHPNANLVSWLGEVSTEYMLLRGRGSSFLGVPAWSLRFYHDG